MSRTPYNIGTPVEQSTSFTLINQSLEAVALKPGPRLLLTRIVSWCGSKGRCWYSVETMATKLGVSVRTVQRWKKELIQSEYLAETSSPYRSPYLIPYPSKLNDPNFTDVTSGVTDLTPLLLREERIKERCTVDKVCTSTNQTPLSPKDQNGNAIKIESDEITSLPETSVDKDLHQSSPSFIQPPVLSSSVQQKSKLIITRPKTRLHLTPDQFFLVEQIEQVTGDTWSRGNFINLVRQADEQTVYAALSITREKKILESGVNLGAYFTATLKGLIGLGNLKTYPSSSRATSDIYTHQNSTSEYKVPPLPVEAEPFNPESMKKGWRLRYSAGGVQPLLSLVKRCVPESFDIHELWMDVKAELPGTKESILVDRFLDTVVVRIRHMERIFETV